MIRVWYKKTILWKDLNLKKFLKNLPLKFKNTMEWKFFCFKSWSISLIFYLQISMYCALKNYLPLVKKMFKAFLIVIENILLNCQIEANRSTEDLPPRHLFFPVIFILSKFYLKTTQTYRHMNWGIVFITNFFVCSHDLKIKIKSTFTLPTHNTHTQHKVYRYGIFPTSSFLHYHTKLIYLMRLRLENYVLK